MLQLNFSPFPVLTTERLLLRQLTIDDEQQIFTLRSDDKVNRYLDRLKARSVEEARGFIQKINTGIAANQLIYWGISLKQEKTIIGAVGIWNMSPEKGEAEIGYELLTDWQRKGLMQEALSKIIEYGFEKMKLSNIKACSSLQNERSVKLLEKLGFKVSIEKEDVLSPKEVLDEMVIYRLSVK